MLVPDPKVVRQLLTRYATLRIAHAEQETPQTARGLTEVSDALCTLMGESRILDAITAADEVLLAASRTARARTGRVPDTGEEHSLSLAV
ncbi:DUF5133 domain-containing protein [Streptomyces poonensis]|uniref:DUF5133 domain-containing protein n=1 Tax=Streptomyces poonensis TaxID=68255 RepID=A0A918Q6M9_9ACTN|nr:DUF5133 domain-containing protein [Streptomyces poonensis]GGZ35764.1 hypothetical protein GCM10010365_65860 [Streptomyces poonensis]GLJ89647.1 hypothetical protein GCM10017589_22470 [Streptomyces poonensis]